MAAPPVPPWIVVGLGAGNWPVVTRPMVLVAPVEIRLTAELRGSRPIQFGELDPQQYLLLDGRISDLRLLTTVLAKGVASAVARSAASLFVTRPVSDRESRED